MRVVWIVLWCVLALAGGLWRLVAARLRTADRLDFATEFLHRFQRWAHARGQDNEAYAWLVHRSARLQREMGGLGIMRHFKPAFAQYVYSEYPVVLNFLPELRRQAAELRSPFGSDQFIEYASTLQEAIVRYIGTLDDAAGHQVSDLRNPLAWVRSAVQFVLLLPLSLLEWSGLDRYPAVARVTSSWPAQLVSAVGVLASIVTILDGWDRAVAAFHRWFGGAAR